jgi:hypothetical protein
MLTKSKIALSLALVLGSASVAIAAPKHHPVRHQSTIQRQVPASAYLSFGAVRPTRTVQEPEYMKFQDQGIKDYIGE